MSAEVATWRNVIKFDLTISACRAVHHKQLVCDIWKCVLLSMCTISGLKGSPNAVNIVVESAVPLEMLRAVPNICRFIKINHTTMYTFFSLYL